MSPDDENSEIIEEASISQGLRLRKSFNNRAAWAQILPVSDDVVISLSSYPRFLQDIDRKALFGLVQERNIEGLAMFGGDVKSLAAALDSDPKLGISSDVDHVIKRMEMFGSNYYIKPPVRSFFSFVVEAISFQISILLTWAIISVVVGIKQHGVRQGWYDGAKIIVPLTLFVVVNSFSKSKKLRQFDRLWDEESENEMVEVRVLRGGRRQTISILEVVVGDVVCLSTGDRVPADGLFLNGRSMKVHESNMNGETREVDQATNPFLLSETMVVHGYGRMIVTSVGVITSWGIETNDLDQLTPLRQRLPKLFPKILKFILLFVFFVVLAIRYFTGNTRDNKGRQEFTMGKTKAADIMETMYNILEAGVAIIVVSIPQGLILAATFSLSYSKWRMKGDNAAVQKLWACETMGSATTICTDKTSTLTSNQMEVTQVWIGKERLTTKISTQNTTLVQTLLQEDIVLNTSEEVYFKKNENENENENKNDKENQRKQKKKKRKLKLKNMKKGMSGSPTENSIMSWAVSDLGADIVEIKQRYEIVHVEAFNSFKKRSGVLARRTSSHDGALEAHWKGAAEMILGMCSDYYDQHGTIMPMSDEDRKQIRRIIDDMAKKSLRCIAFAHKKIANVGESSSNNSIAEEDQLNEDSGFTLLSIVGIENLCLPGVREGVLSCKDAGVDVKMITGDNKLTATAIALECGILGENDDQSDAVVEGATFRNYTKEERMEKVDMIRVMARSSPIDKLLMVECLKKKGHVVAVTGDGSNDTPALKRADIGLSMGIQGTEVAKQSSDIMIMDDDFNSVVTALKWGRCVHINIQKFIQFKFTLNIVALFINVLSALSSGFIPLQPTQLLWVNLIMNTLGALALATEQPTDDLLKKKPVVVQGGRTEALITKVMWRNIIAQAVYQITVLIVLEFKGTQFLSVNEKIKDTVVFNSFVLCQVFNEFNARNIEKKNIFTGGKRNNNILFFGIILVTVLLQVLVIEFLNNFASTQRLNWVQWFVCILIGFLSCPIAFLVKLIPVSRKTSLTLPTTNSRTSLIG
ncbi:calcium-transporting ATPase 12, plasma membrane-type-like [Impatiens glandulifera]|uniref:calcium-transporting ATPase 12, plasma membrane-type-like n=1 Tax=Impatiens glandulifera TaxID=253017 RepID=UPI001FB0E3F5|nr:calcium-transporting ATPase 12, plasma membrane-type-like [Impatiens glandulifera]